MKNLLRKNWFRRIICALGAFYIWLVYNTNRTRHINRHIPEQYWQENKPFILAFWHSRLLLMSYCWNRRKKIHMLISKHPDGQLIARTVKYFNIDTIAGSTSKGDKGEKGGTAALRNMIKFIKQNEYVGITPDGPRGPREQVQIGVVQLARLSGVPIIPVSVSSSRYRVLRTWDRFMVNLPFGRATIIWGKPVIVSEKAGMEDLKNYQQELENELNRISRETDEKCGVQRS